MVYDNIIYLIEIHNCSHLLSIALLVQIIDQFPYIEL